MEGFGFVAYGVLTYREPKQFMKPLPPFIALNYPIGWQQRYEEQKYSETDPIVIHSPYIGRPYLWRYLSKWFSLDELQQRTMDEAEAAGLKNGVCVPLHGPWGKVAVVSFASSFADADPQGRLGYLAVLATQFHASFIKGDHDVCGEPISLSEREKDCLLWTAEGKSSWDMSVIMAISESTVNFHLKNAMQKLGAVNRTTAVVKAIQFGLVRMPSIKWEFMQPSRAGRGRVR